MMIKGKGVALNPGHYGTVGATGINKKIKEEVFTYLQAIAIKKSLDSHKVPCDILLQNGHDLTALGRKAAGYDMFLSLHFNAAKNQEFYSCFITGLNTRPASISFGKTVIKAIATDMGYKIYNGDGHMKNSKISVLNSANKTNCPIVVLLESEFIDDEINEFDFKRKVLAEADIIAECILKYYGVKC